LLAYELNLQRADQLARPIPAKNNAAIGAEFVTALDQIV